MKITGQMVSLFKDYPDVLASELLGPSGTTPHCAAKLDVPAGLRLWLLLRRQVIPKHDLRLLACLWAERALNQEPEHQHKGLLSKAIVMGREYASGKKTTTELEETYEQILKIETGLRGPGRSPHMTRARQIAIAVRTAICVRLLSAPAPQTEIAVREVMWTGAWIALGHRPPLSFEEEIREQHLQDVVEVLDRLYPEDRVL